MPALLVDAHQDIAYNALTFQRDYLRSARETRVLEAGSFAEQENGRTLLGWPEYQQGQVALIFATLFIAERGALPDWETQTYRTPAEARALWQAQLDHYERLAGDHPDRFRLVRSRAALEDVLAPWRERPADPQAGITHPVGLVLLMENAEGLRAPGEMEEWFERGIRLAGPVWAANGMRFCGGIGTREGFTREGIELLEVMAGLGLALDISHMNERSALWAIDHYEGPLAATHANCRALLHRPDDFRHLSDEVIRRLVERDAVIGLSPYARWLRPGWSKADDPQLTGLADLAAHFDHICQLAGDARHAGLGTDFDGGFGWPAVPHEVETIADLPRLADCLAGRGYSPAEVAALLGGNWIDFLQRSLPSQ